ncbi:GxGYxYP domain-containing protein [Proteiniphilum sp. X52]|uniref:GxGYxYP domain-containing protein n=1 Tax=Proteiniphilum sp. X52 TaxID=2382159 RepID=UPI000F0A8675|nr:GxGYxYP domain-containing protein [Proteiniphilum sp. X52]RNC64987.1 hypothetical protein D7D25_08820 [Proteiniphilum sp. X52]
MNFFTGSIAFLLSGILLSVSGCDKKGSLPSSSMQEKPENAMYVYTLKGSSTVSSYDEAMAVACIQGILNRDGIHLYVLSNTLNKPSYWLDKFMARGWLAGKEQVPVSSFEQLLELTKTKLKGVIIWDTEVPATMNVATTLAGLEDALVLSPDMANTYLEKLGLPVIKDFRGVFTGVETGSKKNDAYRWAIREFLETGRCNPHWLYLYEDSYMTRHKGNVGYVVTRDWAVYNRGFVYDLSPWGDETPLDDPGQALGTDLQTYKLMLEAVLKLTKGQQMTEVAGFFSFPKYSNIEGYPSKHDPVPTEWETVYQISPYNCYQNTVAHNCFNQSIHSQAPQKQMKQGRPQLRAPENGKTYISILMADYDSATPLYEFMPTHWEDKARGSMPFLWGINPNLSESYPDIMQYLYETKTDNDFFAADASAAGYMNPNRIDPAYLPLFIRHNKKFYEQWDMSLSPMVLDTDEPSPAVKDAFVEFSPDGFATIVIDFQNAGGKLPEPHIWKGMPVIELINNAGNFYNAEQTAREMSVSIPASKDEIPQYYFFRIIWTSPNQVISAINRLKEIRPELDIEVIDAYNFFHFFKTTHQENNK